MGTKSVKVKTLADKYGVSVKEIIKELESQGFGDDVKSASSVIPPDAVELVKSYLDELMAKRGGEPGRGAGKVEERFPPHLPDSRRFISRDRSLSRALPKPLVSARMR